MESSASLSATLTSVKAQNGMIICYVILCCCNSELYHVLC
jgi:hypothetical protein